MKVLQMNCWFGEGSTGKIVSAMHEFLESHHDESLAGQKVGAQMGTIQSQLIETALPDSELFELDTYPSLATENGDSRPEDVLRAILKTLE